jgi:hypothetical protein
MTAATFSEFTWQAAKAGRLTASAIGSFLALVFVFFAIGEGLPALSQMTFQEQICALGVFSIVAGLIGADIREGLGGAIAIAGWLLVAVSSRHAPLRWLFTTAAGVGVMHVLAWWRLQGAPPRDGAAGTSRDSKLLRIFLWIALAAFLLLCVNEVFGEPPIMVPTALPQSLSGTWTGGLAAGPITLNIAADRSVTGSIAGARVVGGQLIANRTWFGRLMHWRTEYLIHGRLSSSIDAGAGVAGDRFTAPIDFENARLAGALFLFDPGRPTPVHLLLTSSAPVGLLRVAQ